MTKIHGHVVRPGAVVPGFVEVDGPTILSVEAGDPAGDDVIVPGFVDLHCHGGGGHTFTRGDAGDAARAAAFHLGHGTTTMLASLVSSPYELMRDATEAYLPLVRAGAIAGIHFEGPYLSGARCGAQNPAFLRDPSIEELTALVELGAGAIRMVTIAPELPGALDAVRYLAGRGVIAALGHTDATYEQTLAGVAAGATVGTHVFNGMPPAHHREPGPILALLDSPSVVCEFVADGTHLHDGTLRFAAHATGPDRAALITDAMDAAGMPDGQYELGGQDVTVAGGVARLTRNDSIAGSTLTMDAALRQAVGAGLGLPTASAMASTTPARALGLGDEVGALEAGLRADLVVLSADLRVKRVMRAGEWIQG
ncbi:N-acetylglucosamine-6-phosphate deacetylase [Nucisporomicrobium flavum]|uniref:N-acetylglucosamine-6-phosphate deacetylase n=1 Tax=Nucisporomicrobium flavum TaxID=2785915 RepID=UPI0018F2DC97|nr:N-acetylglucosamine-6-phosphate deacetylase [Nucisporomicrobium flavum]